MLFMLANLMLAVLPSTRFFAIKRIILRRLGITIGEGSSVCSGVQFFGGGRVVFGAECWVGQNITFYTSVGADIIVGDRCDLAPQTCFMAGSHEIGDRSRRAGPGKSATIVVKDGCWIGVASVILGGAIIGESCMVAARSLVLTGGYDANGLYAGSPIKRRRELP
jgi:maltose O-acetyltransferase